MFRSILYILFRLGKANIGKFVIGNQGAIVCVEHQRHVVIAHIVQKLICRIAQSRNIAVVENEVWDRSLTMDRRILFEHIQELLEL